MQENTELGVMSHSNKSFLFLNQSFLINKGSEMASRSDNAGKTCFVVPSLQQHRVIT